MNLLNKEPVKRVESVLKKFNKNQKILSLESSARTALEAASSLSCEVGAIVKSLLFRTKDKFILCLIAGDKKASFNKLKKLLEIKDLSMASADDVKKITGFTIGGVSPVGHLKKIDIFIDSSLNRFENLYAAAGHPNCIFNINFIDLQKITSGFVKDIIE